MQLNVNANMVWAVFAPIVLIHRLLLLYAGVESML